MPSPVEELKPVEPNGECLNRCAFSLFSEKERKLVTASDRWGFFGGLEKVIVFFVSRLAVFGRDTLRNFQELRGRMKLSRLKRFPFCCETHFRDAIWRLKASLRFSFTLV